MTIATVKGILAAPVATGGTFVVGYPAGKDRGSFSTGVVHKLSVLQRQFSFPEDFTIVFGAASATITYNGATTLPAGSPYTMQFHELGTANPVFDQASAQQVYTPLVLGNLNLGSPGAASANSILLSAAVTAAVGAATALTGALVSGGVANLDARTGRNVVAAWTGAAILTVRGFDMFGKPMTESSASGISFTGKKAFKTVTSIQFNADVTACTIGTGVVLGLPAYVPNVALVLKESQDNAAAAAGTIVAGLAGAKPTATNADIRGTYVAASAPDGSKSYALTVALADPAYLGAVQFTA